MKRLLLCVGVLLVLLPASAVMAEFYRYRDANGVTRFTDNLADVPVDQRPKVASYSEPEDFMTPEELQKKAEEEAAAAAKSTPKSAFDAEQNERMRLNKVRLELDAEYGELMKEKEAVAEMKAAAKDDADRTAYREKVIDLNKRIISYETRRKVYEDQMEAFSAAEKAK